MRKNNVSTLILTKHSSAWKQCKNSNTNYTLDLLEAMPLPLRVVYIPTCMVSLTGLLDRCYNSTSVLKRFIEDKFSLNNFHIKFSLLQEEVEWLK